MQDGTIYEGQFLNDKYHGKGSLTMRTQGRGADGKENRKIFTGVFNQGKVPAQGKIEYTHNGEVYYGAHVEFER